MITDERYKGMNVTRGVAVIRYNPEKINGHFLNEYLNSFDSQRYFINNSKGATLKGLNLDLLRKMEIIIPPVHLQEEYISFVTQVDKSKFLWPRSFGSRSADFLAFCRRLF